MNKHAWKTTVRLQHYTAQPHGPCPSSALRIRVGPSWMDHLLSNSFKSLGNKLSLSVAAVGQDPHQSRRIWTGGKYDLRVRNDARVARVSPGKAAPTGPLFSSADCTSKASRSGWKLEKGRTVPRVPQDMLCKNPNFPQLSTTKDDDPSIQSHFYVIRRCWRPPFIVTGFRVNHASLLVEEGWGLTAWATPSVGWQELLRRIFPLLLVNLCTWWHILYKPFSPNNPRFSTLNLNFMLNFCYIWQGN